MTNFIWQKLTVVQPFKNFPIVYATLRYITLRSSIFWDIMPRSPLKVNRHFEGTCPLHLQGRKVSQGINQRKIRSKQNNPLAKKLVLHRKQEGTTRQFMSSH
jgi:hypothetical protein